MLSGLASFATAALLLSSSVVEGKTKAKAHQRADWPGSCTDSNIQIRKNFNTMNETERKGYTDAIQCIANQPSMLNQTRYPAAINRYFDYAVTHVNMTRVVHLDAYFLLWHRYYIHLFHQDLIKTCGYTGSLPYWNWADTADNMTGPPIFRGDAYSMGGDGVYIFNQSGEAPVNQTNGKIILSPFFQLPHGTGGGCIKSGPFSTWNRTMDTISIDYLVNGSDIPKTAFDLKPSCLTRDLNPFAAKAFTNQTEITDAVSAPNISAFYTAVNGQVGSPNLGIHGGAHFSVGDPLSNIFTSVQDPIWWPLHTMLDRVFTSWQMAHPKQAEDLFGTMTALNLPPSANVTLDSVLPGFGYFDVNPVTVADVMKVQAGPFCYKYDTPITPNK